MEPVGGQNPQGPLQSTVDLLSQGTVYQLQGTKLRILELFSQDPSEVLGRNSWRSRFRVSGVGQKLRQGATRTRASPSKLPASVGKDSLTLNVVDFLGGVWQ